MTARVDATRTTVQRILAGFCERNWAVKSDGTYVATGTGCRVLDAYDTLAVEIERAHRYRPFDAHIGSLRARLPSEVYTTSRLTVSTTSDPLAPLDRFLSVVQSAEFETLRGITPIVTTAFNRTHKNALEAGVEIEVIIDTGVLEVSQDSFGEALTHGLESDAFELYVHPEPLTFGLSLFGEQLCIGAYDGGNLTALLETTDETSLEWAHELFATYRSRSRAFTVVGDG
ncbi:helix-turn-helix transcriptional regulator (plasmid) [Haloferacaceae archaeon DSL9]